MQTISGIFTQDGALINCDNIIKIAIFTISNNDLEYADDAELGDTDTVYLIDAVTNYVPLNESEDNVFTLGVYDDLEKADSVMEQIVKWVENGMTNVFRMPK